MKKTTSSLSLIVLFALSLFFTDCKSHKKIAENYSNYVPSAAAAELLKKGNKELKKKNYQEALTLFNKTIELDPQNGEAFAFRGMAKYNLKDYKGAIEDYDEALRIIPDYGEVYDLRGIAKAELKNKPGACEDWNKAFELGFNGALKLLEKYCQDYTK